MIPSDSFWSLPPQFLVEHQADPYGDQGSAGRGQAHGQQGSGKGLAGSVDQRDPGQDNGNHIMEKGKFRTAAGTEKSTEAEMDPCEKGIPRYSP